MSTNATRPEKGTDAADVDLEHALEAGVFGIDTRGRRHRYDPVRATIYVTHDHQLLHVEQLAREAVAQWIDYVADEKGGWAGDGPWWDVDDAATAYERRVRALDDLAMREADPR